MQDVDEQIPTTAPHMGHANLTNTLPYPHTCPVGLAIDRCITRSRFTDQNKLLIAHGKQHNILSHSQDKLLMLRG